MRTKRTSDASDLLMTKVLQSVLDFLIRSGLERSTIQEMFSLCISRVENSHRSSARSKRATKESNYVGDGNVTAEVMRAWHRDSHYLDKEADPRPLAASRGKRSLKKLIEKLNPSADSDKVIQEMRSVGLIRMLSDGRFIPTAESVKIDSLHPLAIEHIAKSVVRLVTTVSRNTDPSRRDVPLIERYAYVPDLSRSEALAFVEFTRSQGMAYLEAVDDWLEQRRVKYHSIGKPGKERKGLAAGVHLFAYLGDRGRPVAPNSKMPMQNDQEVERRALPHSAARKPLTHARAARV